MDITNTTLIGIVLGAICIFIAFFMWSTRSTKKALVEALRESAKEELGEQERALVKSRSEEAQNKRSKSLKYTFNVHFRLTDFTIIMMNDAERIAYLENVGKEQEARDKALREAGMRSPGEYWKLKAELDGPLDPFPTWLSDALRRIAKEYNHEMVYDVSNQAYVASVYGDQKTVEAFVGAVDAEYTRLAESSEECGKFKLSHRLEPKIFIEDEHTVMEEYKRALAEASGAGSTGSTAQPR